MTGVMPDTGVPPSDARNSLPDPNTNCPPGELWYSTLRCQPRFDPAAANAGISEILNAVNCSGLQYNCSKLDNLCLAIKKIANDAVFGCLTGTFVDLGQVCGTPQQISVVREP